MSLAIIIIRCPHCGTMQIDQFSLMTASFGGGHATSNAQSCARCRRIIPTADHSRSRNTIHLISGRGNVVAFAVELVTSLQEMVGDDGSIEISKLNYENLPPLLKLIYELASRSGLKPAAIFGAFYAILNWAQPFLLEHQSYLNASALAVQGNTHKLEQIEKESDEIRKTLELEYRLKRELMDHQHELDGLSRKEQDLIEWLEGLPKIQAPADNDTYQGALGRLKQFLDMFNQLNERLKAIEADMKRLENEQKAMLKKTAGGSAPIVEFPRRKLADIDQAEQ